jgi:hypothetical protein
MPSAPAMAASGQPALIERCALASPAMQAIASCGRADNSANNSPVRRAGMKFKRSSIRAAAQPNDSWRAVRWPIMESSVFTAL